MSTQTGYQAHDYARATAALVATMPTEQAAEVYGFAQFLRRHRLREEEAGASNDAEYEWLAEHPSPTTKALMEVHDAWWDVQFASTDETKLASLIADVDTAIAAGHTALMFDETGEFIEP
jgi:hypothetical protein